MTPLFLFCYDENMKKEELSKKQLKIYDAIKRFYKEKDHIRLVPENDNYSDIILNNCEIVGKVIGLYRQF